MRRAPPPFTDIYVYMYTHAVFFALGSWPYLLVSLDYVPMWLLVPLTLASYLVPSRATVAHGDNSNLAHGGALRLRAQLPARLPLQVVRSGADAAAALRSDGAFTLLPGQRGIVAGADDAAAREYLDRWLQRNVDKLAHYTVRQPHRRQHALLLFGDAGGAVATVVGGMLRALTDVIPADAELAELGAFVVSPGAEAQDLHPDRTETGYVSCQLALHDTPGGAAGGVALWPGSAGFTGSEALADSSPSWEQAGWLLSTGQIPSLPVSAQPAGALTCYDGRVWHHGQRHDGKNTSGQARRVLYITSTVSHGAGFGMSEGALHPRLRCLPLRNAPAVLLDEVRLNATWFVWHNHCTGSAQQVEKLQLQ